jgi:hypothetical protein
MKLSDVMSAMQLASYAEVALVLFMAAFAAIAVVVFRAGSAEAWEQARHLPLEPDPDEGRHARTRSVEP